MEGWLANDHSIGGRRGNSGSRVGHEFKSQVGGKLTSGGLSSSWKWKTTVNWGNQSTGREWNNAYLGIISSKVWGLIRELLSDNAMSSTLSMEIRKTCVHI